VSRGLLLDRDGVLIHLIKEPNGVERPAITLDEVNVINSTIDSIQLAHALDVFILVLSNQPDIARRKTKLMDVEEIHSALMRKIPELKKIYFCPHDEQEACACRKPKPGMISQAESDFGLHVGSSWMVGDRWVDIAAGKAAGCKTALINRPYSWLPTRSGQPPLDLVPDLVLDHLDTAAISCMFGR